MSAHRAARSDYTLPALPMIIAPCGTSLTLSSFVLQTSARPREVGGNLKSRRGHGQQLSISDSNHHVTEAIGDMYGDDEYSKPDSRPLSFVSSPLKETAEGGPAYVEASFETRSRQSSVVNGSDGPRAYTAPPMSSKRSSQMDLRTQRSGSFDHTAMSPNPLDAANAQFPLNDIDYESNPAAVAQELSNLQALRRMSMDVANTGDPDLPSFQGAVMPSLAPSNDDDEDDPSRLFWVPAAVHPELAPLDYKTFVERRVQAIKRRSGSSQDSLEAGGLDRSGSGGGLRRKKSMLSRQIDNSGGRGAVGYKDGAEKLQRRQSSQESPQIKLSDLQELDELVKDPTKLKQLTLDSNRKDSGVEGIDPEDMPILPIAPGGMGLRRSTNTTYRKGSLRRGAPVPYSKRARDRVGPRGAETDGEESPTQASSGQNPEFELNRVQTEPASSENFSRPARRRGTGNLQEAGSLQQDAASSSAPGTLDNATTNFKEKSTGRPPLEQKHTRQRSYSSADSSQRAETPVPQIVETPPPAEESQQHIPPPPRSPQHGFPQRSSSVPPVAGSTQKSLPLGSPVEPPPRSSQRPSPASGRQPSKQSKDVSRPTQGQTLNDMTQNPSPLLNNNSRTDSLTFIPTVAEEKKPNHKLKKDRDDGDMGKERKTSGGWGWFKNSEEKDKKDKKRVEEEPKKGKSKVSLDKPHDSARLDVLHTVIDPAAQKGRESLVMDRSSLDNKLLDERRKDGPRRSGEGKREKDGLFSSLFGGGKKKGDKESSHKKANSMRALSPEPPPRKLVPDVDYEWTRFNIQRERAIYRLAHLKLANPRRALHSQVLLSNFMYSYLAKVQQMHPHLNVPQSAAQRKQQEAEERRRKEEKAAQQNQNGDGYKYDYHQVSFKF